MKTFSTGIVHAVSLGTYQRSTKPVSTAPCFMEEQLPANRLIQAHFPSKAIKAAPKQSMPNADKTVRMLARCM